MTWHWRLEDPAGAAIDPATLGVEMLETDNQGDAESWLGENWRELLDKGVATVTLFDGDDEVYGPMGLAAPLPTDRAREPPGPGRASAARGLAGVPDDDVAEHLVDALHDVVRQLHPGGLDVVVHLLRAGGADDRRGDVRVLQHPGEGELRHAQTEVVGDRSQVLHPGEDVVGQHPLHGLAGFRVAAAAVGRRLLAGPVLAGEHARGQRRPDDLGHAFL